MRDIAAACLVLAGCIGAAPWPQTAADPAEPVIALASPARQGALIRGQVPTGTERLTLSATGTDPVDIVLAPDGAFVIGLDRDAGADATLVATLGDGLSARRRLSVAPAPWPIERVDAPLRPGPSSAFFARRRAVELEQIAAARASDPARLPLQGWRTPLHWPIAGRISGRFGAQRIYRGEPGSYHGGTDIAAAEGAAVRAPADGVVTLATDAPFTLEGNLVLIDHGGGLESALMHLSRIDVVAGRVVRQGEVIGAVGHTGRATGPHLHWGLRWRQARLDAADATE